MVARKAEKNDEPIRSRGAVACVTALRALLPHPAAQPSREAFEAMREAIRQWSISERHFVLTLRARGLDNPEYTHASQQLYEAEDALRAALALADKPERGETT